MFGFFPVSLNSAILNLISVCYSNLDQYEKSIEFISKAIKLSPQEIGYYINKVKIIYT